MNIDDEFEFEEFDLPAEFESDGEAGRFRRMPPGSFSRRITAPRPSAPRPIGPRQPSRRHHKPPRWPKYPPPVLARRTYLSAPDSPAASEYVRWVQTMLNQALNLQLPVDGILSVETRSAIRSFQEKNGLPVTGIVGPDTEQALIASRDGQSPGVGAAKLDEPSATPPEPGMTAPAEPSPPAAELELIEPEWASEVNRSSRDYIKWVQQSLNQVMGLKLVADGSLGPQTRSAIRSFQQKHGLRPDGIVGAQTEAALKAALGAGMPSGKCDVLDNFEFDRDTIRPIQQTKLIEIAKRIVASRTTAAPISAVQLIGHTDPVGSAAYNLQLGRRRAEQVRVRLSELIGQLQRGLASQIAFTVESRGETQPISREAARNRRVEMCLQARPGPAPIPPRPAPPRGDEDQNYNRWFETGGTPPMQPVRAGNDVRYLIDGRATFAEMVRAIRTATTSSHYIYLLGWRLSDDFELITGDKKSTMWSLLAVASSRGVQVRAMLSQHVGNDNRMPVVRINALTHGAAIHDDRFLRFGSHHQKILIVKGSEGLIAFCGGIDIVANRVVNTGGGSSSGSSGGGGSPLHDVHCRISGPVAHDLLRIFLERWQDHPDHGKLDGKKGALLGLKEAVPGPAGKHVVQIGRTYGNGVGYRFAPRGEQTAKRMILKAIQEARQFIYIEDQYLVSMELSRALQAALPRIQHLTIVMPDSPLVAGDMRQPNFRRQQFIAPLKKAGGSKVRVFVLSPPGKPHTYIHSKMYVIDDRFAIIGSANGNRRSFTHDSEVTAGIFDGSSNPLAKQLRIDLWAEHLNMNSAADRARLADGVMSAKYWLSPPAGARIAPYNENANIERIHTDVTWNNIIDPDGS